jgi:D-3-phosphoglycerate dehydrogenase
MKKVACTFRNTQKLLCAEAQQMLRDAGFELVCNNTPQKLTREQQKEMIRDAYGIIAGTEPYDEDMLSAAPHCRVIVRFGVGLDNFDLEAMKRRGIHVGVIANYNAVAEFALTLMLGALKYLPQHDAVVRRGQWNRYSCRELTGKTVGLVGFGRIGSRLAQLLQGFGVTLLVYDPYVAQERVAALGGEKVSLEQLLGRSDIVSLHLPATPQTKHLINSAAIAQMKDGAYLINTARGALVDENALVDALRRGKLSGAGLDVFESEPVAADHPLLSLENVVVAPHAAAQTWETNYNGGLIAAQSILQAWDGGAPLYPVKL